MNSDEHQGSFARRFSVPMHESYPLKRVSRRAQHTARSAKMPVLSVDSRLAIAENWRLVNVHNHAGVLCYASVLAEGAQLATSTGQLFPFPPEAVAHVACFFKYMALAHRRFVEQAHKHAEQQHTADEHEGRAQRHRKRRLLRGASRDLTA
jgi:hypothetical protein